jgi:uncharacterized membrane protein YphA (DoxX/SURF4 family)
MNGVGKNTLAPLVLRLALGVIFVYHGVEKVRGPNNTWGASWVNQFWHPHSDDAVAKLKKVGNEKEDDLDRIGQKLVAVYAKDMPPLPETVQMHAVQIAVAWGELVGGLALLLGLLTRVAAIGLLLIQVGAVYTVTFAKGFSFAAGGGYEYNISLLGGCLALAFMGAGTFAFDHWLMERDQAKKATPAAT